MLVLVKGTNCPSILWWIVAYVDSAEDKRYYFYDNPWKKSPERGHSYGCKASPNSCSRTFFVCRLGGRIAEHQFCPVPDMSGVSPHISNSVSCLSVTCWHKNEHMRTHTRGCTYSWIFVLSIVEFDGTALWRWTDNSALCLLQSRDLDCS